MAVRPSRTARSPRNQASGNGERAGLIAGQVNIERLLAFVFGVIFVSAILYFVVTVVNPTPLMIDTFKTVLAIAAAGVAAVIPGVLEFRSVPLVRAGGALAVFAIIYFAPPSIVRPVTQLEEPTADPAPVVANWFQAVDSGNFESAWRQTDPATSQWFNLSHDAFLEVFRNVRTPLGKLQWRRVTSRGDVSNPPNLPPGLYRNVLYLSKFENLQQCNNETITLRATDDLKWRVFSHQIFYNPLPCLQQQQPGTPSSPPPAASPMPQQQRQPEPVAG